MSTQTTQYLMWATRLPYKWHEEWEAKNGKADFYSAHESFISDSAFDDKIVHHNGLFCAFDGRDARFIFIGRVLAKAKDRDLLGGDEPIHICTPTAIEIELIDAAIRREFGVEPECALWLFTQFR